MNDAESSHGEIPEAIGNDVTDTDIVFNCPHCEKSLVIDYRGAGMIITCTSCHQPVQVPIPDGMRISDLDNQDSEALQLQLGNIRAAMEKSERRQRELEKSLAEIHAVCERLQQQLTEASITLNGIFRLTEGLPK